MATPQDAGAVAEIYLPYVHDTAISFEVTPPRCRRDAVEDHHNARALAVAGRHR
jgi:L-amino acid N-acyltransferase YncA